MNDLKPCLKCGSEDLSCITPVLYLPWLSPEVFIKCNSCERVGPIAYTYGEAVYLWNTRYY